MKLQITRAVKNVRGSGNTYYKKVSINLSEKVPYGSLEHRELFYYIAFDSFNSFLRLLISEASFGLQLVD